MNEAHALTNQDLRKASQSCHHQAGLSPKGTPTSATFFQAQRRILNGNAISLDGFLLSVPARDGPAWTLVETRGLVLFISTSSTEGDVLMVSKQYQCFHSRVAIRYHSLATLHGENSPTVKC